MMGLLISLLILLAIPIGIVILLVNVIGLALWLVQGVLGILLFIFKPFKWLLYLLLAATGIAWLTSD